MLTDFSCIFHNKCLEKLCAKSKNMRYKQMNLKKLTNKLYTNGLNITTGIFLGIYRRLSKEQNVGIPEIINASYYFLPVFNVFQK